MDGREFIIETVSKMVTDPALFAFFARKIEFLDRVAIEAGGRAIDHGIMPVYSHHLVVMRDGEDEDFSIELCGSRDCST